MNMNIFQSHEAQAKQAIIHFFGEGSLETKLSEAEQLTLLEGIEIFMTPVPWRIDVGAIHIGGLSETMKAAGADIGAHLRYFKSKMSGDEQARISLDEKRLHILIEKQKERG